MRIQAGLLFSISSASYNSQETPTPVMYPQTPTSKSFVTHFVNRSWRTALTFFAPLCLGACVMLVGPYDATIDRIVTDLTVRTETAIAAANAGQLSATERDAFYNSALGTTRSLIIRAEVIPKNQGEITDLKELEKSYLALQSRHIAPYTTVTIGLEATLKDIQLIEYSKKRSLGAAKPSTP
jgi:hypothetical protein